MTLHSTSNAPERILLYGTTGTGKSHSWLTIANWYRNTNTPGTFYVLDTDNAVARMSDAYDNFYSNITSEDVVTWPDYRNALDKFRDMATPADWLIVDLIDQAWEEVQNFFVEEMHGGQAEDFFLAYRASGGEGHPLASEYGLNWVVINKLYRAWIGKVIRFPGNVLCCAPADPVRRPNNQGKGGDSKEILELFGRVGVRPTGQKKLGHQFHTVGLTGARNESWVIQVIKDREPRQQGVTLEVSDFVLNYLKAQGGWEL